ncbi:MAG: glycosyltransferase family 9 protein [Nitrospiraceae bacterium]
MTRQVLVMNVTRMGDLIQTGPLLARLRHEWPDVEVDLLVDRQFAAMAALLPGVRAVHAYDFNQMINECRAMSRDVVALYRDLKQWAAALRGRGYDRLVNLTFTRRTGLLASYIGAPDMRGIIAGADGAPTIHDPWLSYFTDLHRHRRFNRFNIVDLYALGGSGLGPHASLSLTVAPEADAWVSEHLPPEQPHDGWIAVQVGASEAIKAWRPQYFGRTMAALSRRAQVGFVMLGTASERGTVHEAVAAYRQAGGTAPILDMVQRTSIPQAIALLKRMRVLLTNDTGPMHMAVAVGTKVVDLSVGHVDFRETGPYGDGHWVIQPDLDCAPCGFDKVCAHHACKDRIAVEQVAELCAAVVGRGSLPQAWTGVRVFESAVDADGLVEYRQRGGAIAESDEWYGRWWKQYWLSRFAGRPVPSARAMGSVPDSARHQSLYSTLVSLSSELTRTVDMLERASMRRPLHGAALQAANRSLTVVHRRLVEVTEGSPVFGPITVALRRELVCEDSLEIVSMAQGKCRAFRRWLNGIRQLAEALELTHSAGRSGAPGQTSVSVVQAA